MVRGAKSQYIADLSSRLRQHDGERFLAVGGESVAVIGCERLGVADNAIGHQPAQTVYDGGAPCQNGRIGGRHLHAGEYLHPGA